MGMFQLLLILFLLRDIFILTWDSSKGMIGFDDAFKKLERNDRRLPCYFGGKARQKTSDLILNFGLGFTDGWEAGERLFLNKYLQYDLYDLKKSLESLII